MTIGFCSLMIAAAVLCTLFYRGLSDYASSVDWPKTVAALSDLAQIGAVVESGPGVC
jgi:hypothetical protein